MAVLVSGLEQKMVCSGFNPVAGSKIKPQFLGDFISRSKSDAPDIGKRVGVLTNFCNRFIAEGVVNANQKIWGDAVGQEKFRKCP